MRIYNMLNTLGYSFIIDPERELGTISSVSRTAAVTPDLHKIITGLTALRNDLSDLGWGIKSDVTPQKYQLSDSVLSDSDFQRKTYETISNYFEGIFDFYPEENKYLQKFVKAFEMTKIEYGDMKDNMHEQIYLVIEAAGLLSGPHIGFKQYYLDLLSSNSSYIRSGVWGEILTFVDNNIITNGEARDLRTNLFDLLKSKDENIRLVNWYSLLPDLIDRGIIMLDEVRQLKGGFLELLVSSVESIRQEAWHVIDYYIKKQVITPTDSKVFGDILSNPDKEIRLHGWKILLTLMTNKIITLDEARQLKGEFLELLDTSFASTYSSPYLVSPTYSYDSLIILLLKFTEKHVVDREDALVFFQNATEKDPENIVFCNLNGLVLYELKKYHEALECYNKALKLSPDYFPALNNKGLVLYELKKYHEALECYNKATKLYLASSNIWNGKANTLYCLGDYDKAVNCYDKAINLDPKNTHAWNGKANTLYCLGDYDKAVNCYDEVLKQCPNDSYAQKGKNIVIDKMLNLIKEKKGV